jgi:drug/metabolite transporter (DMT)-like permease
MNLSPSVSAAIAVSGNFVLSFGMVLQKRHIAWMGKSPRRCFRDAVFYSDFWPWVLGFMLMNIVPVFTYFALMGLSTNVVGATAGMSVAFSAVLAKLLLKERLGWRRLAWTIALFASIAAAGFLGEGGSSGAAGFSPGSLYFFLGIPFVIGVCLVALRGRLKGPRLAAILAAASGSLSGYMVFPMRALQVDAAPGLSGWIVSPYLYAFLAAGASSFVLVQIAYQDGEMSAVAPALYGMQVLWPAIGTHFVFGAKFLPAQSAAFIMVAVCVAMIAGVHPATHPGRR